VSAKQFFCVCDLNESVPCNGVQIKRCPNLNTLNPSCVSTLSHPCHAPGWSPVDVSVVTKRSSPVSAVVSAIYTMAQPSSNGRQPLRASESLTAQAIKVIPATKYCSQMLVTDNGRWDAQGGVTLGDSAGYKGGVRGREFPFRPGSVWEKQFSGRHATAVGRKQVTIQFTIMYSRKHPDRPNFSARDKDTIPFGKKFVSDSPATLEAQWLSQTLTPQPDDTLKLSGSRFMGLDNNNFGDHWRSITAGFGEEVEVDSAMTTASRKRGKYSDGVHKDEMSDRQQRRIGAELFENFEAALAESFPAHEFAQAFRTLYESRQFRGKYEPLFHGKASQHDEAQWSHVEMYRNLIECKDFKQARFLLSLYAPFNTREFTMGLFGCSKYAYDQACLSHRLRNIPIPVLSKQSVCVLPKKIVEHFEGFMFRPDNVTPKAYGNANNQYLRNLNRNRLFWKYRQERARVQEKAMGKTSFYKQYSSNIFKDMKQETCCCTVCIEKGAGSCDMLRDLVSLVFGGTIEGRKYSDAVEDVEYFYARYYRGMLCESSTFSAE